MPARNPAFTGREDQLAQLRGRLRSDRGSVQLLYGMGGVGKTQLVIEYANRFAADYEVVWWVDAQRGELISAQLSVLAAKAEWASAKAEPSWGAQLAVDWFRANPRWLLVFDNVTDIAEIRPWLPGGAGHVVVTGRGNEAVGVASSLEVPVFARDESTALIRRYLPALPATAADRVASALGDLPLALTQAANLMATTSMTSDEFLVELAQHAEEVLSESSPADYPTPVAAVISLAVERLRSADPAALQLLHLCAWLAPEPIPLAWFTTSLSTLDEPLQTVAGRTLLFRQTMGRLVAHGLAKIGPAAIQLHRVVQAVVRDHQAGAEQSASRRGAERMVAAAAPFGDAAGDPPAWPAWATTLPHLLALDPAQATPTLYRAANHAIWYLLTRGEYAAALPLIEDWHRSWLNLHGPDHIEVLRAASALAATHMFLGNLKRARTLGEENLALRKATVGPDDIGTLASASNLASTLNDLGEYEKARALEVETLARRRAVFGDDHPHTLASAINLATSLFNLGDVDAAYRLDEASFARRKRVHGDDHPRTLTAASSLARDLRELGDFQRARELDEETLAHRRRILGDSHPDTIASKRDLAADIRGLTVRS